MLGLEIDLEAVRVFVKVPVYGKGGGAKQIKSKHFFSYSSILDFD